jgi:glycosyltransferase involved in cell wall biosynthesis
MRTEFVSEEERIRHYAAADIVVLPSLYEPFGIVCTEAMSMEKPTVVGARGTNGMREQVISSGEKQCGVHINPFEPKDIAWGLVQVLQSQDKAVQWGKNGRQRVLEEFSWDAVNRRTLDIYKEFLR